MENCSRQKTVSMHAEVGLSGEQQTYCGRSNPIHGTAGRISPQANRLQTNATKHLDINELISCWRNIPTALRSRWHYLAFILPRTVSISLVTAPLVTSVKPSLRNSVIKH